MPQGSHMKGGKSNPRKPKITRVSKKGCGITKKIPKKSVVERNKMQKAMETHIKANIEKELKTRAGGTFTLDTKNAPSTSKGKKGGKGKKK